MAQRGFWTPNCVLLGKSVMGCEQDWTESEHDPIEVFCDCGDNFSFYLKQRISLSLLTKNFYMMTCHRMEFPNANLTLTPASNGH
jgi:hypothetical protein